MVGAPRQNGASRGEHHNHGPFAPPCGGLTDVAGLRARKFSLGMAQRLGIAAALLGDPPVLLLDEPVNGLDPAGIHWIRDLLTSLAARGRAVLVSSHLISEVALMADHLVVIGQGRLLADTSVAELSAGA